MRDAELHRLAEDPQLRASIDRAYQDLEAGRVSRPMTAAEMIAELEQLEQLEFAHDGVRSRQVAEVLAELLDVALGGAR